VPASSLVDGRLNAVLSCRRRLFNLHPMLSACRCLPALIYASRLLVVGAGRNMSFTERCATANVGLQYTVDAVAVFCFSTDKHDSLELPGKEPFMQYLTSNHV